MALRLTKNVSFNNSTMGIDVPTMVHLTICKPTLNWF
jgi:hypothetical protein